MRAGRQLPDDDVEQIGQPGPRHHSRRARPPLKTAAIIQEVSQMIDTEKLDKLQRYSRAIAALSLAIFFALIVISLWSLWRVRREVADLKETKQSLDQQVANSREELQMLAAQIKVQEAVLKVTLPEKAKQSPELVKEAINQVTDEQPNNPVNSQENKRIEYTKQAIQNLIQTAPSVARNLTRVFLQITEGKQRPRARLIAEQLKQAGYIVPAIEDVSDRKLRIPTQVRYSDASTEAEKAEAKKILNLLREWGIEAKPIAIGDSPKPWRPWQYEIWFGSDFN